MKPIRSRSQALGRHRSTCLFLLALTLLAGPQPSVQTAEPGPDDAKLRQLYREASLQLLKEGNLRFAAGKSQHPSLEDVRRVATARDGQEPFVTVLSCSDSRVPPELLFDRGLGELFVIRVAGNVADTDEIATAEYGVGHLHTPILLVLGHTRCGAVTAVAQGAELHGSLPHLVDNIQPAVERARAAGGDLVPTAIRENTWQSIEDLVTKSEVLHKSAKQGSVKIIGAIYDIETGRIDWLGEHPRMATFLENPPTAPAHAPAPATAPRRASDLPPGVSPPIGPPPAAANPTSTTPKPAAPAKPAPH